MEITFAPTFFKSLKKMIIHQTWWYKTIDIFRKGFPRFFKNIWKFRKELYDFQPWEFSFNMRLFSKSLSFTANYLEKYGYEIEESRNKKIAKIRKVVELMNDYCDSNEIDQAEKELGIEVSSHNWIFKNIGGGLSELDDRDTEEEKINNQKIFNRANEIEETRWKEIWQILQGQNIEEYKKIAETHPNDDQFDSNLWNEWYDGSGARGWWD